MAEVKTPRRGGRKKNEWTLVTLKQLLGYIDVNEIKQKTFAAHLGVTNSTFHNWKKGRCAPDELVQGKIKALIDGKEKIIMVKKTTAKKTTAKKVRASRGAGSSTLAALTGGDDDGPSKKVAKKKTKKVAKVAKKVAKRRGRVTRKIPTQVAANGNGFGDWNELEALGQFVRANEARSPSEIGELIGELKLVAKIFG